jgi:hypothetical protein
LALIFGMTRQASRIGNPSQSVSGAQPYRSTLDAGLGSLASVYVSGRFVVLHFKSVNGDTIITVNPADGHEVGRIQVPAR